MTDDVHRVVLLDSAGDTAWVEAMLADLEGGLGTDIIHCDTAATALVTLESWTVDLVLVDLGPTPGPALDAIQAIREADPAVPILAVTTRGEDRVGLLAIRAGAQDYIVQGESNRRLSQAVAFAIERSRAFDRFEAAKESEAREREFTRLRNLCGPAPLAVSGRSFGSIPLRDRSPQAFLDLARNYERVLVASASARSFQEREDIASELNGIADRLGVLNAGPRDVIDVHKMAIARRLEGVSMGRARAAIEEARMLLLQLMGYLASFYRNLSWGAAASGRSSSSPRRLLADSEAAARKNEK
jgi:CheY-like chemotaxis protein